MLCITQIMKERLAKFLSSIRCVIMSFHGHYLQNGEWLIPFIPEKLTIACVEALPLRRREHGNENLLRLAISGPRRMPARWVSRSLGVSLLMPQTPTSSTCKLLSIFRLQFWNQYFTCQSKMSKWCFALRLRFALEVRGMLNSVSQVADRLVDRLIQPASKVT